MRLIDADAIPYTMLYKENWLKGTGVEKPGVWKDTIDAMPTIEPERKKGKWMESDTDGFVCSVCRNGYRCQPTLMGKPMFEYCPVCGADMREDQHDQSK